jgi:NAD(P)-dependent dehydrogenase (short-subunit alcohol dehydrogenase family)
MKKLGDVRDGSIATEMAYPCRVRFSPDSGMTDKTQTRPVEGLLAATVEELGALTLFLASEAAASITGVALPMDGGWTAH